jgi:hypothetical protein
MMRVQAPAEPVQLAAVQLFGAVNVVAVVWFQYLKQVPAGG